MQKQIVKTETSSYNYINTWASQPQQQQPEARPLRKRKPYIKPVFSAKAVSNNIQKS